MGTKHFIVMLIVAVASLLVGTCLIGIQVAPDAPTGAAARPDRRIGDQTPGGSSSAKAATWTPDVGHGLYSISVTLAHTDSQVQKFADFGLLLPTHLPDKSHLGNATLLWTPKEQKRLIQVEIRGKVNGLISEYRIKEPEVRHPRGIFINTVQIETGAVYRNLQSSLDGVGISLACSLSVDDEELIQVFKSMKPIKKSDPVW